MSLSSFVARVGVNPTWIAANAHCWFAYAVVHTWGWMAIPALALAAGKEFYFDARYETPKQTFTDNLTDFLGYSLGVGLALAARMWV